MPWLKSEKRFATLGRVLLGFSSAASSLFQTYFYSLPSRFFYVKNHGVSLEMQDKLEAQSRAFFAHSSDEDKHQLHMRNGW